MANVNLAIADKHDYLVIDVTRFTGGQISGDYIFVTSFESYQEAVDAAANAHTGSIRTQILKTCSESTKDIERYKETQHINKQIALNKLTQNELILLGLSKGR